MVPVNAFATVIFIKRITSNYIEIHVCSSRGGYLGSWFNGGSRDGSKDTYYRSLLTCKQ